MSAPDKGRPVTELRVSPDGRVAQLAHVAGRYGTDSHVWVGITWPDGLLTVHRYTEDEVAAWTPLPLPTLEVTPPCCTPTSPHPG